MCLVYFKKLTQILSLQDHDIRSLDIKILQSLIFRLDATQK